MGCGCSRPDGPGKAAAPAPGVQSWDVNPDLQVRLLQPGIWLHTSWHRYPDGSRMASNGLLVEESGHLLLIDTAWGDASTGALLNWIDQELHQPVTLAIITHAHDDRIGGATTLVQHGIPFVAHAQTRAIAARRGIPLPESLGDLAPGSAVQLDSVEVFYPGPAHAPDNLMVWIPDRRVLFGGCAVKAEEATSLGNLADADLASWPSAMRRTQERYGRAGTVVPGHGAVGGPELLQHTVDLLNSADRGTTGAGTAP